MVSKYSQMAGMNMFLQKTLQLEIAVKKPFKNSPYYLKKLDDG